MDATSPVIAQYCNTLNGEQIISSGETFWNDKWYSMPFYCVALPINDPHIIFAWISNGCHFRTLIFQPISGNLKVKIKKYTNQQWKRFFSFLFERQIKSQKYRIISYSSDKPTHHKCNIRRRRRWSFSWTEQNFHRIQWIQQI